MEVTYVALYPNGPMDASPYVAVLGGHPGASMYSLDTYIRVFPGEDMGTPKKVQDVLAKGREVGMVVDFNTAVAYLNLCLREKRVQK
jgi:hypothetical protein